MTNYWHYYLRAETAEEVTSTLVAAGLLLVGGEPAPGVHIDTLGTLFEGGVWDEEGNQVEAPTALPGWHVNLCTEFNLDVSLIASVMIDAPTTPRRIWSD
ncbi:hypothetical protein [Pseudomonas abyssi]|uniref:Uncharacterized protein n=1 Tax=Pseudomonas abyssi TaxID=170540 RepID=A0A395RAF9_9PSED|nr:hypothetical protein [Halopseudomonas gallaeciensis]RGP57085.1 hypothetical protein ASB58_07070 [Halopseudomonas gallaeciensis]